MHIMEVHWPCGLHACTATLNPFKCFSSNNKNVFSSNNKNVFSSKNKNQMKKSWLDRRKNGPSENPSRVGLEVETGGTGRVNRGPDGGPYLPDTTCHNH